MKKVIDDWMYYYNHERYQWQLAKLSPNEYYRYITTGVYPLKGVIKEPGRKEGSVSRGKADQFHPSYVRRSFPAARCPNSFPFSTSTASVLYH